MGQVDRKVAVVTGGASGIGAACATTLAREGVKVVITDLDDAAGRAVAEKIGGAGGDAIFLHHDVSVEETPARHRKRRALPRLGRVQLHDRRRAGDRRRDDGWYEAALWELTLRLER